MGPLFALYTTPLSAIISSLDINHHPYVDDIQIYMSLSSKESLREVTTLFNVCIGLDGRIQAVALTLSETGRACLFNLLIEDEYHFLLKCDVFSDIRVDYINNIMRNNADFINFNLEQKFTFLITKYWRETLIFLCKAWSKRKTCLYL